MSFAVLCMLLACGAADGDSDSPMAAGPCDDAPGVSWDNFADGFFGGYCRPCHAEGAEERYGAPVGMDFDDEEQVAVLGDVVRRVVLEEGSMPVGGGVLEDDLTLLAVYLECGI